VGVPPKAAPQPSSQPRREITPTGLRKAKQKPFSQLLGRSRSIKSEQEDEANAASPPRHSEANRPAEPEIKVHHHHHHQRQRDLMEESKHGLKTAPLQGDRDRSFRDMMSSSIRHRSADRQGDSEAGSVNSHKDSVQQAPSLMSSFRESSGSGSNLFSNIKTSSTKAAGGLGKAGKGIFGKLTRSGSSGDQALTDDSYACTTINLPLVQQTRRTRISKRLEHSKDKTEFWMPALPWRCIE
jgi:hypothetical protein